MAHLFSIYRSSHQSFSVSKDILRNFTKFTGKHLCQSLFFNKVARLRDEEVLAQLFSCGFCEISKNTFSTEHLLATASKFNTSVFPCDFSETFRLVNYFSKLNQEFCFSKKCLFLVSMLTSNLEFYLKIMQAKIYTSAMF